MQKIIEELKNFRDERDWSQFHNPKDLGIAISIEANELLQEFLWKSPDDADLQNVKNELADILTYCCYLADIYKFDLEEIMLEKLAINRTKYPIDKAKGNASKYTEF